MRRRHPLVAWTIGKLRSMRANTTWLLYPIQLLLPSGQLIRLRACRFGSSFHLGSVRVLSFLVPGTTILPSICDDGTGGSCLCYHPDAQPSSTGMG
ncbi:hypothetical protein GE21DRAFT_1048155 [Neurospora crassa]|nr:hypothetical protein GE21DRAFT_1048155 [Neurospora crassa]